MRKADVQIKRLDYVPEPQPPTSNYLIGCHYFPAWRGPAEWKVLETYPDRTPLLGYYDSGNPEVADWEMKWALEHGISFWVYVWYRPPENVGKPHGEAEKRAHWAIHETFFNARWRDKFKFAIMWENHAGGGAASEDDLLENLLPFWIENYFRHPRYLVLDNKPLLFVYWQPDLTRDFGTVENIKAVLDKMRDRCRKEGFDDLMLLCEHRLQDIAQLRDMKASGFDYAFSYCWYMCQRYPPTELTVKGQIDRMEALLKADVIPFIPGAAMGWDPMPWHSNDPASPYYKERLEHWQLQPPDWKRVLEGTKELMTRMPKDSLSRRMVFLGNWDEWGEGHYIAPHVGGGFGYLKAVREVFTRADNKPDYRLPAEVGLGPYDLRYRKYLEERGEA